VITIVNGLVFGIAGFPVMGKHANTKICNTPVIYIIVFMESTTKLGRGGF
jgi:hypothetical protein